jgi:hypothetical protein
MSKSWELLGGPMDGERVTLPDGKRDYVVCRLPSIWPSDPAFATAPVARGRYRDELSFATQGMLTWQGWDA